ncbi:hypothetical protein ARMSODRAFT_1014448 [Armillaria solidipes]|uniref:DUF1793-domain-containing protein n=1 Tax=Armillaria solidipes TaxID=1076256 RepID=A0A2H3BTC8_9AGAR|nr:hypothetical protein ARMSODRAFT_1014448 [Armillaria solidipes]
MALQSDKCQWWLQGCVEQEEMDWRKIRGSCNRQPVGVGPKPTRDIHMTSSQPPAQHWDFKVRFTSLSDNPFLLATSRVRETVTSLLQMAVHIFRPEVLWSYENNQANVNLRTSICFRFGLERMDSHRQLDFQIVGELRPNYRELTGFEVTPTRTIFSIQANTTNVNVTFLSPIEPSDLVLQSLPFFYVYIDVESNDGQEHSIQLFTDINNGADSNSFAEWRTTRTNFSTIHQATRQTRQNMQEINDIAEDATVYYAFPISDDTTYQTGGYNDVGDDFIRNGALFDSEDINFRRIEDNFPVLAVNLNNITRTISSVVWAIGLVRDPVTRFYPTSDTANNSRSPYFRTTYNTIDFFLRDFPDAKQRAIDLDLKVVSDASQISDNYADLVALAARQAMAIDITVSASQDNEGQWNGSDVMAFVRDMDNLPSRRVNPVEILYATFPAYLYFNSTWAGYLLEPLLRYQQSLQYTKTYAAPDLGQSYPNVDGNNSPSPSRAIEDSGNMLIMGWAHARFSGDGSMISRYYDLYKQCADYLVNFTLSSNNYMDADELNYTNMTNLAIKGIIGIKAMSEISQALENSTKSKAELYVKQWQTWAGSTGHLLSTYGAAAASSSWSLVYNLFADKLLGTALVDFFIYSNQDNFYSHEAESTFARYGIPYDSDVTNEAKTHWTMFAAGASSDTAVRDTLVTLVHAKVGSNTSAGVFPLSYDPSNGNTNRPLSGPGQGTVFSLMALSLQNKTVSGGDSSSSNNDRTSSSLGSSKIGAIAGGVVGGLAALTLLVFGVLMYRRRQWRKHNQRSGSVTPFFMGVFRQRRSPKYENEPATKHTTYTVLMGHSTPILKQGNVSTTASGSSSVNRSGASDSDNNNPTIQLRSEMENLRREVDEMRARNLYEPPQYA